MKRNMTDLTSRQKIILSLIVHEHTRTAQPVASKTLIEDYGLPISSATVRNEMNTLAELGLIRQPTPQQGVCQPKKVTAFLSATWYSKRCFQAPLATQSATSFINRGAVWTTGCPGSLSPGEPKPGCFVVTAPHSKNCFQTPGTNLHPRFAGADGAGAPWWRNPAADPGA